MDNWVQKGTRKSLDEVTTRQERGAPSAETTEPGLNTWLLLSNYVQFRSFGD